MQKARKTSFLYKSDTEMLDDGECGEFNGEEQKCYHPGNERGHFHVRRDILHELKIVLTTTQ